MTIERQSVNDMDWLPIRDAGLKIAEQLFFSGDPVVRGASLGDGVLGVALLCIECFRHSNESIWIERSRRLAASAFSMLHGISDKGLFTGDAGLAWLIRYAPDLQDGTLCRWENRFYAKCTFDRRSILRGMNSFDIVEGTAGLVIYFLRRKLATGETLSSSEVVRLLTFCSRDRRGRKIWRLPGDRCENLGMAHGAIGVLSIAQSLGGDLEALGGSWVADYERQCSVFLNGVHGDLYPVSLDGHQYRHSGVIGWCYGPLGFLILAARRSDARHARFAEMCINGGAALARAGGEVPLQNLCLCHGAAGVALGLWRASREPLLADLGAASLRLYHLVVDSLVVSDDAYPLHTSLLCGRTGIALALLAAGTNVEWHEIMGY